MLKHLRHTYLANKNLERCCGNVLMCADVAEKWNWVNNVR
jgi:hypothetical protein